MSELIVDAKKESLREVFDFVTAEVGSYVEDRKLLRQIKLCVEEIFTNISSYAYQPSTGTTKIIVRVEGEPEPVRVFLSFVDSGQPFDPLAAERPDTESDLDKRQIGGLGIFLVKNTVDGISYEYSDGQNILTIEKALTNAG